MILASVRFDIANFLSALINVYVLLIFLYIVLQLLFSVGLRPPYSKTRESIMSFLREVCEPFLRIFRSMLPQMAGFDLSPILAIISLEIFNAVVVQGIIHG